MHRSISINGVELLAVKEFSGSQKAISTGLVSGRFVGLISGSMKMTLS